LGELTRIIAEQERQAGALEHVAVAQIIGGRR
jgi:hypothetical protein